MVTCKKEMKTTNGKHSTWMKNPRDKIKRLDTGGKFSVSQKIQQQKIANLKHRGKIQWTKPSDNGTVTIG